MNEKQVMDRELAEFMRPFPKDMPKYFEDAITSSFLAGLSAGANLYRTREII